MKYQLRPIQAKAVGMIREEIRKGNKAVVLQASCGFGKTMVASYLMESVLRKGKRAIFICDRITLIDQCAKRLHEDGIEFGVIQADHPLTDYSKPIQIASIQTLQSRKHLPDFDIWIIDECQVLFKAHIELMKRNNNRIWLGLSATPWTKSLGKYFKSLVIPCTTQELIDDGLLVPLNIYGPSKPDLSKVRVVAGEYKEDDLAEATNTKKLVGDIVDHWLKLGERRPTMAFAVNVAHSLAIVEAFQRAGISAAHVDGYMDGDEKKDLIDDFKSGRYNILSSVDLISRGFDFPGASCGIMARPTKSLMLHIQQLGRLMRTFELKKDGIILDHSGNCERLGFPTDDMPTELDDGRKKSVKDAKKDERLPKPCPSCHYLKITAKCPRCGFQAARQAKDVEHVEGKLVLLKGKEKATKVKLYTTEQKEDIYAQLLGYAKAKGYKEGWCYYKHKELTGTFPARKVAPKEPTPEILGKIKWLNIRNAKRNDKQAALELMDL